MKKAILAVAAAAVLAPAAGAITGGQLDGAAHPNVGVVVAEHADGIREPLCSGTLVGPRVFVTAAHCLAGLDVARVLVSFDATLDLAGSTYVGGTAAYDPQFALDRKDSHDVGVVLLDAAPEGVVPAELPAAGALERLAKGTRLTNVGYGYYERATGGGQPQFLYDGNRRWSTSALAKVDAATLTADSRGGGVCYGDSGGPRLLGTVVAAITSTGNGACTGKSVGYRLDTPSARAFLARYVTLP